MLKDISAVAFDSLESLLKRHEDALVVGERPSWICVGHIEKKGNAVFAAGSFLDAHEAKSLLHAPVTETVQRLQKLGYDVDLKSDSRADKSGEDLVAAICITALGKKAVSASSNIELPACVRLIPQEQNLLLPKPPFALTVIGQRRPRRR